MNKKLAEWFLGELRSDYPADRLRGPQGFAHVREQLTDLDRIEIVRGPSGPIVRRVRRSIVQLNYVRIQVWIDSVRDWMAFTVLNRRRRSLEEIATWRDHYYLVP